MSWCSDFGFRGTQGWGLGVAESIAAVIVIGFSVDFTVHLAHMYSEAGHHFGVLLRGERMAASARTMGVTVTMGACTTLGSGLMLWACTLTFFTKFAVLIISTVSCPPPPAPPGAASPAPPPRHSNRTALLTSPWICPRNSNSAHQPRCFV